MAVNDFGNVVVRAADNAFWRICPEELSCTLLARTQSEFDALWQTNEFQHDWRVNIALLRTQPKAL